MSKMPEVAVEPGTICGPCGYPHPGHAGISACPECGTGSEWCYKWYWLDIGGGARARRLSYMLRVMLACAGAFLLVMLLAGARHKWWPDLAWIFWIEFLMGVLAGVGMLYAVFGFTDRDIREPSDLDTRAYRIGARISAAGCLLSIGAGAFVPKDPYFSAAVAIAALCAMVFVCALGHVARGISRRAASSSLTRQISSASRALVVESILIASIILYVSWRGAATPRPVVFVMSTIVLILLVHLGLFTSRLRRLASLLASIGDAQRASRERLELAGVGYAEGVIEEV